MAAKKGKVTKKAKGKEGKDKGDGIDPVPKTGPNLTLRARNHVQIGRFKKAAASTGHSLNTWAIEVLDRAAAS